MDHQEAVDLDFCHLSHYQVSNVCGDNFCFLVNCNTRRSSFSSLFVSPHQLVYVSSNLVKGGFAACLTVTS